MAGLAHHVSPVWAKLYIRIEASREFYKEVGSLIASGWDYCWNELGRMSWTVASRVGSSRIVHI